MPHPVVSVKMWRTLNSGQCQFDWVEICCIGLTTCGTDRHCYTYLHCSQQLHSADCQKWLKAHLTASKYAGNMQSNTYLLINFLSMKTRVSDGHQTRFWSSEKWSGCPGFRFAETCISNTIVGHTVCPPELETASAWCHMLLSSKELPTFPFNNNINKNNWDENNINGHTRWYPTYIF